MIHIPVTAEFTARVSGSIIKEVHCEHCGCEYVYFMNRQGTGSGTSVLFLDNKGAQMRATAKAEKALRHRLDVGCDAVPCPDCGWYQAAMRTQVKWQRHRKVFFAGLGLLLAGGVSLAITLLWGANTRVPAEPQTIERLWTLTVFLGAGGVLLTSAALASACVFDPNASDPEARKQLGAARAARKADFDKMQQPDPQVQG